MRLLATLLLLIGMIPILGHAQQTVGGEFFFNSYLDFGKGIPFTLANDQSQLNLDVASADEGFNVLYLRTKDNLGKWSLASKTPFYKHINRSTVETVEMEYVFDTYQDIGKGKKIPIDESNTEYLIDLDGLTPGLHVLYLRTKNTLGQWSHIKITAFYLAEEELAKIVSLRYQFLGTGFASEVFTFSDFEPTTELSLDQNQFMANASGLEEGKNYTLKIIAVNEKGQQSIVYTYGFELTILSLLNINEIIVTEPTCFGVNDGKVEIEAVGEDIEIEYSLNNITFQEEGIFENLPPGAYIAYIRDKNDTENLVQESFEITGPTEIQVSISNINQVSCPGDSNGGFTVNATGGAGSFTYKLSTQTSFQEGNQFGDLTAGDYSVTVKDGNGCESSSTVQITAQNESPAIPTITIQGTDGISTEVQLVSSSASGNQWLRNGTEIPGATGQTLEITQAGSYQVQVTGGSGCSSISATTVITELGEIQTGNLIKLFPNPANDIVRVKFEREFYLEKITIVNSQGILVNILEIQKMTDEVMIEVTRFAPGNYILLVEGVGMNERLNLIKR
ncbi:T9SS type A sorting domain-containing protein [Aquiflexum sp.]|uniref:T9SS type A sorting domain-containing protein n=1 Tax=Aquiflexum sp. TaxID=1872584 RepID=UPI0035933E8E